MKKQFRPNMVSTWLGRAISPTIDGTFARAFCEEPSGYGDGIPFSEGSAKAMSYCEKAGTNEMELTCFLLSFAIIKSLLRLGEASGSSHGGSGILTKD
ncbi:hypothetical protein KM043_013129 [Ampulex compressa]|nr:hypothetical protein KM043_013129 [Ampulex compressa]